MLNNRVALIDIGSNTIRLVLYAIDSLYNFTETHNVKTPARLSQYIDYSTGEAIMSQTGIDVLIEALTSFMAVANQFDIQYIYPMATAAIRQSANQEDILAQVKAATHLDIQIVPEKDEAGYGAYAIIHSTTTDNTISIDIGGGSCEVSLINHNEIIDYHSFPFGAVSLSKKFFAGKVHNDLEAIAQVRNYVKKQFKSLHWLKKAKLPITAIGGSARNVANVYQRQVQYPMAGLHGFTMDDECIRQTLQLFIDTPYKEMENIDGLSTDRIDLIIPATIVFEELMNTVKTNQFIISTQGLREGIILKHINDYYNYPVDSHLIRTRSIRHLIKELPVNTYGLQINIDLAIKLYTQVTQLEQLPYSYEMQELVEFAASIYQFGGFISPDAESQHTFYMLSNMDLLGFSHPLRLRLALLASYRNRSLYHQYLEDFANWLSPEETIAFEKVGGILKFARALNDSRTGPIKNINLKRKNDGHYVLEIYHDRPIVAEYYKTQRQRKHLERVLDRKLDLQYIQLALTE